MNLKCNEDMTNSESCTSQHSMNKHCSSNKIISHEEQAAITRVIAHAGQLLQAYNAESRLIEQTTERLGMAFGLDSVEIALTSKAIILTSRSKDQCVTTTRTMKSHGIDMGIVCEVQRICILAEKQIYDVEKVKQRLNNLAVPKYNSVIVACFVALSCACFSHLFGGDSIVFIATWLTSFISMRIRQWLTLLHHNLLTVFFITAFTATFVGSFASAFDFGNKPELIMVTSVLQLVPGFPLINAVSDMVKGHVTIGMARWMTATLLTLASTLGIVLAVQLAQLGGWL
ncbi:threonine/serine ThrE exporter family protein [Moritella viscosa]|uniref:threonine/serine ThrE exporter family protein n=1 Tax=Moritella viscosa TaxID=80854 RepID=UPI000A8F3924|nr:threonine/serine exporter family protein [Moritella viscosa]